MKAPLLAAATLLAGGASAEVHKLKLNKVPLEEQLVSWSYYHLLEALESMDYGRIGKYTDQIANQSHHLL